MTGSGAVAAAVIASVWALAPLQIPSRAEVKVHVSSGDAPAGTGAEARTAPFDGSAFQVRLWNAPPGAVANSNETPEPPPAPPDLELIAIITERQGLVAALYELGAHRMHLAAPGDRIGRIEIVAVDEAGVDLRDDSRAFRLALTPGSTDAAGHLTLGQTEGGKP